MEVNERIRKIREKRGLSTYKLSSLVGLSQSAISKIESGKRKIDLTILNKIAQALNVSPSFLFTGVDIESLKEKAKAKYGELYSNEKREKIEGICQDILNSNEFSLEEKTLAAEQLFKVYFSRSVENSGYNLEHPLFEQYSAMLLNQNYWQNNLPERLIEILIKKYGSRPGIPEGKIEWEYVSNPDKKSNEYGELTTLEQQLITKWRKISREEQLKILGIIEYKSEEAATTDETNKSA